MLSAQDTPLPVPNYDGVFYRYDRVAGTLVDLEHQTAATASKPKALGRAGYKAFFYLRGAKSPVRFKTNDLQFIVSLPQRTDPHTIQFFVLRQRKDRRELVEQESNRPSPLGFGQSHNVIDRSEVPIEIQKYGESSYRLIPSNFGIPGRTAASASNSQEIDLYVALSEGVYVYDAVNNLLVPTVAGDFRVDALTPGQRGIDAKAPVQLIYVVDVHRLTRTAGFQEPGLQDPEVQKSYYFVDTGLIAGNVYLFAAAQGLAAWFHNCDKTGLAQQLGLRAEQRVLFAQSIGYPEKE